jgi:uncharacterized protein
MTNDLIVKKSLIHGKGVFAGRDFAKGEVVLETRLVPISHEQAANMTDDERHFLVMEGDDYFIMPEPERYINHSCDANTAVQGNTDIALRDIKEGEEITSNYGLVKAEENFICKCGSCEDSQIINAGAQI